MKLVILKNNLKKIVYHKHYFMYKILNTNKIQFENNIFVCSLNTTHYAGRFCFNFLIKIKECKPQKMDLMG